MADRIIVIDGGRIVVECGHEELMSLKGLYADMFIAQAGLGKVEKVEPENTE